MNGKAADLQLAPGFLGLGLGQPDASDLRFAIGAAGIAALVEAMHLHAGDRLDHDHALMLGLVRQHRRAGDVADGPDARDIGAAMIVDNDGAALDLHADLLEPEILGVALHADRRDQPVAGTSTLLPSLSSTWR